MRDTYNERKVTRQLNRIARRQRGRNVIADDESQGLERADVAWLDVGGEA